MKKQHILLSFIAVLILLIPFAYQSNYLQADESDYYSKIRKGLKYFQKVYDRVQSHYVEEIDPYELAVAGGGDASGSKARTRTACSMRCGSSGVFASTTL